MDSTLILLAIVVLLALSNIYFIFKLKHKNSANDFATKHEEIQAIDIKEEVEVVYDSFDTPENNIEEPKTEEHKKEVLTPSKPAPVETPKVNISKEETLPPTPEKNTKITRRDVPKHGKITKENFKEFAGTRILVAEDNIINQKVIAGLLADTGIEITIANDGKEALDILEADSNFSIILMDAHMPRIDGFEATRAIRANPNYSHILVVALSGDTAIDDIRKMSAAGMQEHLEKPLRIDALYDILYAYSDREVQETQKSIVIELDVEKGLENCGEDKEFYQEILDEFISTYGNSTNRLHELLTEGKLQEADKLLLDIVGLTATIGADNLHNISNVIKEALNDTQEKSYLTLIEQYKVHLIKLIEDIKEYK